MSPWSAQILALIWDRHDEYWVELGGHDVNGRFFRLALRIPEALARLTDPGVEYFALLARVREGRTKADVVPYGRIVWVEIDHLDGLDDRLGRIGVAPSVVYSSGKKGYWVIWALDGLVSTDDIEVLLRSLATLADGDRRSAERSRLGRIPGSIHHQTGVRGEVIQFDPAPVSWSAFDHVDRTDSLSRKLRDGTSTTQLHLADDVELRVALPANLQQYVEAHQVLPRGQGGRYDRSATEQAIFVCLLRRGFTTAEVATLSRDVYQLPRFLEDLTRGNERRIAGSLEEAARYVGADEERRKGANSLRPHQRRRRFLGYFGTEPQRTRDIISRAVAELGIQERQAFKYLGEARAHELVTTDNVLTDRGRRKLASKSPFFAFS